MEAPKEIMILVVEDEPVTLEFLVSSLAVKYPKAAIHKAMNGRGGLEIFKAHLPDIVITDINMPEMRGELMAEKIFAIKPDTKFIVLTGDSGKLSLEAAVGKGFKLDHYIEKPVDFRDLFGAIDQCMGMTAQPG